MGALTGRPVTGFGPWREDIGAAERLARLRELRALAYLLAPNVEDTVRGAIRQTSAGSYLALDPAIGKKLVENIKNTVGDLAAGVQKPVLLTSMDIRRYLRKMIEQELYDLPVLSYQEMTQEINIQPLARVEL